ncbi:hypothetical protein J6590_032823 [Homalodisca vitripennis]|nr:hypothetical protein J6590_032823 [Homalodisca vitripennis]
MSLSKQERADFSYGAAQKRFGQTRSWQTAGRLRKLAGGWEEADKSGMTNSVEGCTITTHGSRQYQIHNRSDLWAPLCVGRGRPCHAFSTLGPWSFRCDLIITVSSRLSLNQFRSDMTITPWFHSEAERTTLEDIG